MLTLEQDAQGQSLYQCDTCKRMLSAKEVVRLFSGDYCSECAQRVQKQQDKKA